MQTAMTSNYHIIGWFVYLSKWRLHKQIGMDNQTTTNQVKSIPKQLISETKNQNQKQRLGAHSDICMPNLTSNPCIYWHFCTAERDLQINCIDGTDTSINIYV